MTEILAANGLGLRTGGRHPAKILADVDFSISTGQRWGVIGPSGAGKSMLLRCLTASQPAGSRLDGGIRVNGTPLDAIAPSRRRQFVARHIAVLRQDSIGSLNPYQRIGTQFRHVLAVQRRTRGPVTAGLSREWLGRVGLPDIDRILHSYPHELSGGMRQRVSLALNLCGDQPLVVADEPTTALDMPHQKECIDLIDQICTQQQRDLLFVSHDLALVWRLCEHVIVMENGRIIEHGPVDQVLTAPATDLTRTLLAQTRKVRPTCPS
ncbi:ABC transporter ATP-binding protein [Acidipropionibacterium jensenii]|uniref:ABC transporter ATP-binding protein n=1 Tax=Acidipropionibacterium jensenii TaxID=1749 RepID=UPI00110B1942|nr:ATP-binding cassette domain-containing protein [Acidipropionibacterium jensenii]QCV88565.1 ABC transporter ATP-binding protein [Acidipropionibacterium jensenii]